jgi:hypothetical protein
MFEAEFVDLCDVVSDPVAFGRILIEMLFCCYEKTYGIAGRLRALGLPGKNTIYSACQATLTRVMGWLEENECARGMSLSRLRQIVLKQGCEVAESTARRRWNRIAKANTASNEEGDMGTKEAKGMKVAKGFHRESGRKGGETGGRKVKEGEGEKRSNVLDASAMLDEVERIQRDNRSIILEGSDKKLRSFVVLDILSEKEDESIIDNTDDFVVSLRQDVGSLQNPRYLRLTIKQVRNTCIFSFTLLLVHLMIVYHGVYSV